MSETPTPQQATKRVLIVDGSELGTLLQGLMHRNRMETLLARTAGEAMDAILQHHIDLALIELELPDASGVDLLHILRQSAPVPVVIIGATPRASLPEHTQQGLDLADRFFQKPLHSQELLAVITQLLGVGLSGSFTPAHGVPMPESVEDMGDMAPPPEEPLPRDLPTMELTSPDVEEVSFAGLMDGPAASLPPMPPPGPPRPPPLPADALLTDPDHTRVPAGALPPHQFTQFDIDIVDDVPVDISVSSLPAPVVEREEVPDPSDLMAMWMQKREAALKSEKPAPAPSAKPHPANQGHLHSTDLARLLDAFYGASESGTLVLKRAQGMRRIAIARGEVVAATSNVGGEQVTDVVPAMGLLGQDVVDAALARVDGRRHEVLGLLVKDGVLTREQGLNVLVEQRRKILEAAFTWRDGEYEMQAGEPPRTALGPIFMGEVILRGILFSARVEDLRERIQPGHTYSPRSDGPYPLHKLKLSADEARLIIACDGTKSVQDLLAISDLPEPHVLGMLLSLTFLKLVRRMPDKPVSRRQAVFF